MLVLSCSVCVVANPGLSMDNPVRSGLAINPSYSPPGKIGYRAPFG